MPFVSAGPILRDFRKHIADVKRSTISYLFINEIIKNVVILFVGDE